MVLFSGTPCQVSALKSFLSKDYENLITTDFICHGVPSRRIWREYIEELRDGKKIRSDINKNREKIFSIFLYTNYSAILKISSPSLE